MFSRSHRYSEFVAPLIVNAQRRLVSRIRDNGGPAPPQNHFLLAVAANGGRPITAEDYLGLQLRVRRAPEDAVKKQNKNELRLDLSLLSKPGEPNEGAASYFAFLCLSLDSLFWFI